MNKIKMVIPKGRMFQNIFSLLEDSGIGFMHNDRQYVPHVSDPEIEVKIMKPQNISQLVELGAHDAGFTGFDWIVETSSDVAEIMDLELDPVRIIAAIPQGVPENQLMNKKIIVASEYKNITKKFLEKNRYSHVFIQTYGATEAYPPQDADMIIDNTATGRTLQEHGLKAIETLMESSTRFIANHDSLTDGWKREKIQELKMLFTSVLQARERVMLEMNVPGNKLDDVVKILPCMRAPTVSPLHEDQGYAVKVAVRKNETRKLIPRLKKMGASDILEYEFRKVVL